MPDMRLKRPKFVVLEINSLKLPINYLMDKKAAPRFELGSGGFADLCLTTWLCRRKLSFLLYHQMLVFSRSVARNRCHGNHTQSSLSSPVNFQSSGYPGAHQKLRINYV